MVNMSVLMCSLVHLHPQTVQLIWDAPDQERDEPSSTVVVSCAIFSSSTFKFSANELTY